jgi:hypothetical protein
MVEANTETPPGGARLGPTITGDTATDIVLKEFVARVSPLSFVREIAVVERWGPRTVWTVITALTPERTRAVLAKAVDLLVRFPDVQLDFRTMNAEGAGEAGVQQLLTAANTVHLWSRHTVLAS